MRPNTKLNPASHMLISSPDGSQVEQDCVQCSHCGKHYPITPIKGRGFCTRCGGPVCGPGCAECVPLEQWLENREAGVADDHKPVRVSLGGIVLPY